MGEIDAGTTLAKARSLRADVDRLAGGAVTHLLLTHHHFDHILGASVFDDATVYCAPAVAVTMAERRDHLLVRHGADAAEVQEAAAAWRTPVEQTMSAVIDLGDRSGDPCVDNDSDPVAWPATLDRVLEAGGADAAHVPGHGAVVTADFVCRHVIGSLRSPVSGDPRGSRESPGDAHVGFGAWTCCSESTWGREARKASSSTHRER